MGLHDSLVAHAFADVEHARGVLATALPPDIASRIDFSSLRPEKGSFVDEHLKGRTTDLLYSARLAGREAFIYLLWEHKSEPERLAPLQCSGTSYGSGISTSPPSLPSGAVRYAGCR
jgi:predicted transposase YdaD